MVNNEIFFSIGTGLCLIGFGVGYILLLKKEYATSFVLDNIADYEEIPEETME